MFQFIPKIINFPKLYRATLKYNLNNTSMGKRRTTRNPNECQSEPDTTHAILNAMCLKLDKIDDTLQLMVKNQQTEQRSKETKNTDSLLL